MTPTNDQLVRETTDAIAALRRNAVGVDQVGNETAKQPGLYAIHATAATWLELGLGEPIDARPLYVGKAETSLASRDLNGHFATGPRRAQSPTGSSTLRRSLAALLAPRRGYQGMPRNPANPGHYSNYGLSEKHDDYLSAWMRTHLLLSLWPHGRAADLDAIETRVLVALLPPLNLDKITTAWQTHIKTTRRTLAQQARTWRTQL